MEAPITLEEWQVTEEEVEVRQAFEGAFKSVGLDLPSSLQPNALGLLEGGNGNTIAGLLGGWLKAKRLAKKVRIKITESSSFTADSPLEGSPREKISEEIESSNETQQPVPCGEGSLSEKLGKASELDISTIDWLKLGALHRTETSEGSVSEENSKSPSAVEVNVNSGGVVYFALFHKSADTTRENEERQEAPSMAAACLKFAPTRLATQSEKLGSELARHLSVATPQARIVHSCSPEFGEIEKGVVNAMEYWKSVGNEGAKNCCDEFLEALRLSRCLLIMGYVHGRPLLKSPEAFQGQKTAENTASSLGRVLVLDLVLRNPDRLSCSRLGWRGNPSNLIYTKRPLLVTPIKKSSQDGKDDLGNTNVSKSEMQVPCETGTLVVIDSGICRRPPSKQAAQDRSEYVKLVELILNSSQVAGNILHEISGGNLGFSEILENEEGKIQISVVGETPIEQGKVVQAFQEGIRAAITELEKLQIVLQVLKKRLDEMLRAFIAYVVAGEGSDQKSREAERGGSKGSSPRFPPQSPSSSGSGRLKKKILSGSEDRKGNSASRWSSKEPSCVTKLSFEENNEGNLDLTVKSKEENGMKQKDIHNASNNEIIGQMNNKKNSKVGDVDNVIVTGKFEGEELVGSTRPAAHATEVSKEENNEDHKEGNKEENKEASDRPANASDMFNGIQETGDESPTKNGHVLQTLGSPQSSTGTGSPVSQQGGSGQKSSPSRGKWYEGVGSLPSRLTMKIRGVNQSVKGDNQLREQLQWWNGVIGEECQKICSVHDFTTGFLERGTMSLVDSYELKVRLEHVLERTSLVLQGAATERPSLVLPGLFIGGAVAARSQETLLHLGISKILNLCPMDLCDPPEEQENSPFSCLHIPLKDVDFEDINIHFGVACDYIDSVQNGGNKILVHCFEGRSRSAAIVLAYIMLKRNMTLAESWALLKTAHPRARPNDGFMKTLLELDKKLRGVPSMEWKPRKPLARICHICEKMVGFSSDSLLFHMKKKHPGTLMKADGETVVVVNPQSQENSDTLSPTQSSLEAMEAHSSQVSPEDIAKMQLLAVVGLSEPS